MRRAVYDLNAQLTADYLTHGIVQLEYNSPVPANGDGTRSNNNNVGHQPGIVVQSVTLKPRNMNNKVHSFVINAWCYFVWFGGSCFLGIDDPRIHTN